MLKSMTGFGRHETVTDEYKISVEMKAVNHRYLDLSIKMPKKFNYFESAIRTLLKKYIQRGKVDLFINYEDYTEGNMCLSYNSSLAAEYMKYFAMMEEQFNISNDVKVSVLSRMPEVLTMEQVPDDEEHLWKILSEVIEEAAKRFVETRIVEPETGFAWKIGLYAGTGGIHRKAFPQDYRRIPHETGRKGEGTAG